MDDIIIRKAQMDDLEQLYVCEQGVIAAERPFDSTLDDPIRYYDLPHMINADDIELLVAVAGDRIIGTGYARLEKAKPYLKHTAHAYLGFMYVHPAYRGRGINSRVIAALQTWAQSKEVTELRLEVYSDNTPALKAYEKIGFKPFMIRMWINGEK